MLIILIILILGGFIAAFFSGYLFGKDKKSLPIEPVKMSDEDLRKQIRLQKERINFLLYDGDDQEEIQV